MAPNGTSRHETEHKCMGVVEEAREKREARRSKPQPWIALKLAVFMTCGIIAYTWYVYVGRLCVPMIRRDADALGGRAMGIAFLVVFSILGLIMIWAYEKVVLTPPGYARDHVKKSSPPEHRSAFPTWWDTESEADLAAARFGPLPDPPQPASPTSQRQHSRSESSHRRYPSHSGPKSEHATSQNGHAGTPPADENVGITDALPPVATIRAKATAGKVPPPAPSQPDAQMQPEPLPRTASAKKPMMFTRSPPKTPRLAPEYRYCRKDEILKPYRTHHCRACGTCVLRYDHHCPWIGQCVGARNYRFFFIFVFWACLFCIWVFATLVGLNARASTTHPNFDIDGQHVAIMALSGLFMIFTVALLATHILQITNNMTTVEQLEMKRMHEREERVLNRLHAWWHIRARRATVREWDAEWGRIGKEGYIWWLGSTRKNWEATMGDRVWMWFLPIGQSPDDGLSYVVNPRFDSEGRWLPRSEWPAELR